MGRLLHSTFAGVVILIGLVLPMGCSSTHSNSSASPVVCDKCNVAYRQPYTVPGYEGRRQVGYFDCETPGCGQCCKAQESYAKTGSFEPRCSCCDGTMRLASK